MAPMDVSPRQVFVAARRVFAMSFTCNAIGSAALSVPSYARTSPVRRALTNHAERATDRDFRRWERIGPVRLGPPRQDVELAAASRRGRRRTHRASPSALAMSLIPIPVDTLCRILVTGIPTSAQYSAYWGRTNRERYQSLSESFNVSFLGVFGAYFLSFILGQFPALLAGFVSFFWFLISPELKAYQRNWELRGGRDLVDPWLDDEDWGDLAEDQRGLYGAFYFGRVVHCAVVEDPTFPSSEEYPLEDFADYTMETDDLERITGLPWKFRLRVSDSEGRELQVHSRMSEEYIDIIPGMPVASVVLSTSRNFVRLAGMTDICVPDAECWVGDYPYLERSEFEREIASESLWRRLQDEAGVDDIQSEKEVFADDEFFRYSTRTERYEPDDQWYYGNDQEVGKYSDQ